MDEKKVQPTSSAAPQQNIPASSSAPAAPIFRPGTPITSLIPDDAPAFRMANEGESAAPIVPAPVSIPVTPEAPKEIPQTPIIGNDAVSKEIEEAIITVDPDPVPAIVPQPVEKTAIPSVPTPTPAARTIPLVEVPKVVAPAQPKPIVPPVAIPTPAPVMQAMPDPVESGTKLDPLPDFQIPALRTYKNDIGHTVEQDKITTAKILLAEQKQAEKQQAFVPETSVKKPKNIFALVFGILFLVGGFGAIGYFAYTKLSERAPDIAFNTASFFLFAYDKEELIDSKRRRSEIYEQEAKVIEEAVFSKENTYTEIVFFEKSGPDTARRLATKEFFDLYEIDLPTAIERSVSADFSYGLYRTSTAVEPFIVIGLVDFENAFDSMFEWEPTLALDLSRFFPSLKKIFALDASPLPNPPVVSTTTASSTSATSTVVVATSTATTTVATTTTTVPQIYEPIDRNVQFVDVVLSNRDTRALRDGNGTPYFYYTFIDRDKILFAQEPKLIPEIVRKIREKQLVR